MAQIHNGARGRRGVYSARTGMRATRPKRSDRTLADSALRGGGPGLFELAVSSGPALLVDGIEGLVDVEGRRVTQQLAGATVVHHADVTHEI
jgi:hypothetical protein